MTSSNFRPWPPNRRANQAWSDAKLCVSSRRNGHFHKTVSWPSRRTANRTDLGSFRRPSDRTWPVWLEVKSEETQGPFDKKVSGLRLARQDSECVFSATPVSKNSPQASKNPCLFRGPGRGFQGLQLGPAAAQSAQLDHSCRPHFQDPTPSGAVPDAKLGRSWASSGAFLAPRSPPLRWVFFRSSSTALAAQPDLNRSMPASLIIQTSCISAVTNKPLIEKY